MKNVFLFLALVGSASILTGCAASGNSSRNAANQNSTATVVNQTAGNNSTAESGAAQNQNAATGGVPTFDNAAAALEAGKKYFDDSENEKAIGALEQAVKLDPNSAEAHFQLGVVYEIREKTEDAPATETAKPSKNKNKKAKLPETPSGKEFAEAIKLYEKTVDKNPKDDQAYYFLALAYAKINEDEKAEKAMRQAVKLKPDDSEYNYELGVILNKLAQYEQAEKALKKSLELEPENGRTEAELEEAQAGRKRVEFAKKELAEKMKEEAVKAGGSARSSAGKSGGNAAAPERNPSGAPKTISSPQ